MTAPKTAPEQTGQMETDWLTGLRAGSEADLERIFHRYYRYLTVTAYQLLPEQEKAEDLVQDLFFHLWTKRQELVITGNLKAYLRKAIVNRCIDEIRRKKRQGTHSDVALPHQKDNSPSPAANLEAGELRVLIDRAIERLPERCRAIFTLSRFQQLSNKEIAARLGISVKTVENQMTKALKLLRSALAGQVPNWLLLLILGNL